MKKIAVIGLGYVGLPLAHAFAEKGFKEKSKELMPTLKKKTYQSERNSKYLTKKL